MKFFEYFGDETSEIFFGIEGPRFTVQDSGLRAQGSGFRVQSHGCFGAPDSLRQRDLFRPRIPVFKLPRLLGH